uniref:Protein FAR1-RELATED SEQUENCE n=1 Tax=Quercus lobata TaxID=97700 RepID=A0A7N2LPW2_QUELO
MAMALASQWPETHHRLCVWHMYQNAAKQLKEVFGRYNTFAVDFSSCVYNHDYEGPHDQNANVGSRYKVLLKLYSNLAARVALTDESFRISLDAHESTLNKVEANLKNLSTEESTVGSTRFKSKAQQANDKVQPTNYEGNKIKGIKLKGRQACVGKSHRRKGALEKATRKRKHQTKASSHIQQLTPEDSMENLNTPGFIDMLNLIQMYQEDSMTNLNTPGFTDMLNLIQVTPYLLISLFLIAPINAQSTVASQATQLTAWLALRSKTHVICFAFLPLLFSTGLKAESGSSIFTTEKFGFSIVTTTGFPLQESRSLFRFTCRKWLQSHETHIICSASASCTSASASYGGWDELKLVSDSERSGESDQFRNFLVSVGIDDRKHIFEASDWLFWVLLAWVLDLDRCFYACSRLFWVLKTDA